MTQRVFTADTNASDDDDDQPLTDAEVFGDGTPEADRDIDHQPSVEVAVRDEVKDLAVGEQTWSHDLLEFEGDRLEIRLPSEQALSAFSIAVSKYMPADVQNDMVGLFIAQHMSPASYTHVLARMMNPDEPTYTNKTIGQLMSALSKAAIEERKAAKAAADTTDAAA